MSDSEVRIALVGSGWWASSVHLPALAGYPGATVVAVCDRNRDRAARVATEHGIELTFDSIDALLEANVADAAIIATPHVTHYPLARACLEQGLHVLVEKPMTLTAADAFSLVALAEQRGLHLAVGYTYQYASTAQFVRDLVQTEIGDLVQVIVEFTSNAGVFYASSDEPDDIRPDRPHPSAYSLANGGGQATTQLTHAMGMVCWATGRQIAEVTALTDHRGLNVDIDDAAAFRFTGGGMGVAASTGAMTNGQGIRHHVRYIGSLRAVDQDLLSAEIRIEGPSGVVDTRPPDDPATSYRSARPSQAFVDLIRGKGPNVAPPRPAAATVAFLEAMLDSSRTGLRTSVKQLPD